MKRLVWSSLTFALLMTSGLWLMSLPATALADSTQTQLQALPQPVGAVAFAIANMYVDSTPSAIHFQVRNTRVGSKQETVYEMTIHGHFFRGRSPKNVASALTFSVTAHGNKVWGLVAHNAAGKVVWRTSGFDVIPYNLRFDGRSRNWKGSCVTYGVEIWSHDTDYQDFGCWDTYHYTLSYVGPNPTVVPNLKYSLDIISGSAWSKYENADLHKTYSFDGRGNGLMPQKGDTLSATVEWAGHNEKFVLSAHGK